MIKTDMSLKEDIEEELRWDPKVNAAQIPERAYYRACRNDQCGELRKPS